ncbi:MAG: hypothetical protein GWP74_04005, partial [Proteobacteria bacterium]|nr:hypothetical protein [Pseudomonadota bacterium]
MVKAITFDLWDTVIHDDSDEGKRKAQGLASKRDARRELALAALDRNASLDKSALLTAYDTMEAAFNRVWHQQHVTWTVDERVSVLLQGLGRTLPDADRGELVQALEEMDVTVPPNPIDGITEAIAALAGTYKLGVVSDAIYSPGAAFVSGWRCTICYSISTVLPFPTRSVTRSAIVTCSPRRQRNLSGNFASWCTSAIAI